MKLYKYIFNLIKSTQSYMVYGELGATPFYIDIQTRIMSFWCNLIQNSEKHTFSSTVYKSIYELHEKKRIKSLWIENVLHFLCSNGFSGVWYSQSLINSSWLQKATETQRCFLYRTGTLKYNQLLKVTDIRYTKLILSKVNIYLLA